MSKNNEGVWVSWGACPWWLKLTVCVAFVELALFVLGFISGFLGAM